MTDDDSPEFTFDTATTVSDMGWTGKDDGSFNEHGVREREDGSIDVIYRAMEPGIRNGFEMTTEFLDRVAGNQPAARPLVLLNHETKDATKQVGWIEQEPDMTWMREETLGLQFHVPNTGSQIRSDVIADFTHDPPALQQGSIGFDPATVEYELPSGYEELGDWYMDYHFGNTDQTAKMIDAEIREFSIVNFPAGYDRDSGGLSPSFQRNSPQGKREEGQSRVTTKPRGRVRTHKRRD